VVEEEGVTAFGTSAKYLAALEKSGCRPREQFGLDRLRTILSTGSPLAAESFDFVYRDVKADVHLASISGGTDIVSCFVLGNPLLPVHRGELQSAGLGMAVEIYDEEGRPLPAGPGELVCTRAFPSMPLGFWNDADGSACCRAYFERFPNVWTHGDFAERTVHGGFVIHGRSDATLNPGGVRIGTAEIYRAVESLPEVLESLAIGQAWEGDTRIVLFVVLRAGVTLDAALIDRIRATIRRALTPRHVPARIVAVPELPRTRSGKPSELAVRAVVHGQPVTNTGALANPGCPTEAPMSFWRSTWYPPAGADRLRGHGDYAAARSRFFSGRHPNLRYLVRERYAWMNPYLAGRRRVVELGAGAGLSREFLQAPGLELTDVVPHPWLDRAVDALALPYAPGSLDAVICSHMIHHTADPVAVLRGIGLALRPGGVLLVNETVPSICHRLLMWAMRHEGWSCDVDLFAEGAAAKDRGDPLAGNNAVADLLFGERGRFRQAFPGLSVQLDQYTELLVFLVSGGVGGQAFTFPLPEAVLDLLRHLDRGLVALAPRVFALARRTVIIKNGTQG
jgi:SAM-dependent methyltransferase